MISKCKQCEQPFKQRHSKQVYCSHACHDASRSFERKLCPHCGINRVASASSKYCSSTCAHAAVVQSNTIECETCHKPFHRRTKTQRFCGHSCASEGARSGHACLQCGELTKSWYKYCSRACHSAHRLTLKPKCHCGNPILKPSAQKYCSVACASVGRRKPRAPCPVCNGPMKAKRKTCSLKCANSLKGKANRYPPNPAYTPVMLERVRAERMAGKSATIIAGEVGLSRGQINYLLDVKLGGGPWPPIEARKQYPRRDVQKVPAVPPGVFASSGAPKAELTEVKKRPEKIPLREVIRLAREYGCKADIESLSRAVRRIDPTHAGFRPAEEYRLSRAWR